MVDPRRIDLVRSPHVEAAHHLALTPGTNVAMMNAFAHVVVTEGLVDEAFVRARCDIPSFKEWLVFASSPTNAPEAIATQVGVDAETIRAAARSMRGRTEQRFTMVLASQNIPKGPAW